MAKVIDEKFAAIVDATCYWLGYQTKIGRSQLIHEASLRYPIADAITAKGVAIRRIVLEKLHPIFQSKKIDLVIYDEGIINPEQEEYDTGLKEVYEFKIAKKATADKCGVEHQRVFNDVVRLAYYNLWGKKDCYFLMCGEYDDFKTFFVGQNEKAPKPTANGGRIIISTLKSTPNPSDSNVWKGAGLYADWFDFVPNGEKEINFKNDSTIKESWGLRSFEEEYIIRSGFGKTHLKTIKIKTTCMAVTQAGLQNRTHAAGLWKIEGCV